MSVDITIEDETLDRTLLLCRMAYVHKFLSMTRPFRPEGVHIRAFDATYSAYIDPAYAEYVTEPTDDDLKRAGDLVADFDLLLTARKRLDASGASDYDSVQETALRHFTQESLEFLRDHCRKHPNNLISVIEN